MRVRVRMWDWSDKLRRTPVIYGHAQDGPDYGSTHSLITFTTILLNTELGTFFVSHN